MSKVVTFGELMLRLAPSGYLRFVQADSYEASFGGGEANVAISLANFGLETEFVSKIPTHEIGQAAVNSLRKYGVGIHHLIRGGGKLGVYYLEKGASQRSSKVIYDRAGSAISMAHTTEFDWNKIFEGADWFHFTGITPALGAETARICEEACKAAKDKNITISCDLNYRNKLWDRTEARETMTRLCKYVDVCISNEEDAYDVFEISADNVDVRKGTLSKEAYQSVAKQLAERFHFNKVAITLRESISANDNRWSAMLYEDSKAWFSKTYDIHIVDRVGGGDSFGAGLIYSIINGYDNQTIIDFAVAASCLKHSIEGDYNMISLEEVKNLLGGDVAGRIQR